MKKYLSTVVFVIGISCTINVDAETAKRDSIRHLLKITGSDEIAARTIASYLPHLKKITPKASEEFWRRTLREIDVEEIENKLIPVYQKYFTEEEISALIVFFESPEGEKLVKTMPLISEESRNIGNTWGKEIAQKIVAKYMTEYESSPKGQIKNQDIEKVKKSFIDPALGEIVNYSGEWRLVEKKDFPWLGYSTNNISIISNASTPTEGQLIGLKNLISEPPGFRAKFEKVIFDAYRNEIREIYLGEDQVVDPNNLPLIKKKENIWQVIENLYYVWVNEDASIHVSLSTIYDSEHELQVKIVDGKPIEAWME